ncbi:hypothetical protein [Pleionea sp. CnH1-48]|uniref:hypothetical protein n=1 Tax=Pleionea sp. CnH1-48 TaxID=2954494 RepID=UPI0020972320|nr:hypothetical protein [Pleionea sp. CnH1-48]MCO7224612.1 hypothetical protein [Pleionea sp. CnH1-48]
MKKLILCTAVSVCCSLVSASDMKKSALDMIIQEAQTSPEFSEAMRCLGISESKARKMYEKKAQSCYGKTKQLPMPQFMDAIGQCMESFPKELGVSQSALDRCAPQGDASEAAYAQSQMQMEKLERELDRLYANENPSPKQQKRIDEIIGQLEALASQQMGMDDAAFANMDQMAARGMAPDPGAAEDIQRALSMSKKMSQSTVGQITLPIYKNSEILVHMTEDMLASSGMREIGANLPAATFASPDSIKSILSYYQKKLPSFKVKKIASDEYLLMESMPKDFSMTTHMDKYFSTPHVLIKNAVNDPTGMVPANAKAIIEIAYRK